MSRVLSNKTLNWILIVAVVAFVGYQAYQYFDVGARIDVHRAISNISRAREVAKSREILREMNDRQLVLGKLKEALDDEDVSIEGKIHLLQTLSVFKETRTVRRAVESKVASTQRAAIWLRGGDKSIRDVSEKVVLAWLKDENAGSRHKAAMLCRTLELESAVPTLLAVLDKDYSDQEGRELVRHALSALSVFKPTGLAGKLIALASNPDQHEAVRGAALETVAGLPDAPREEIERMAIDLVKDKSATVFIRGKAIGVLRRPSYGNKKVWDALEEVLLAPDKDHITQRGCLNALGNSAPIDQVRRLIVHRNVVRHPYYAVRIDVATALAALNVRTRQALQILNEYLVDEDPKDRQFQVRQEAMLSLYVLTGTAFGVKEKELFQRRLNPIPDPERAREYIWRSSFLRPGITHAQVEAVKALASDYEQMKGVKQTYELQQEKLIKLWEDEAKAKEDAAKKKDEGTDKKPDPKDEDE